MSDHIDEYLKTGLKDLWFPICPSTFIAETPVSLRRLGIKLVLWRDGGGRLHALEDHCPHRGAPLSAGIVLNDRIACPYHGVEVRSDGMVVKVPGSPGCKLEGSRAARAFHVQERAGYVFIFNHARPTDTPPPLRLPEELESDEYAAFPCYAEWRTDYRYIQDNVMDPMHGTFVHKQSHSMFQGTIEAKFRLRDTDTGFIFEKTNQQNVNFDWAEFGDTGFHWQRLSIPYPKTAGPGGPFTIIGSFTPISDNLSAVVHWRCRKVSGWQRSAWQFLFKAKLEALHWGVLEQDRALLEKMDPAANQRESLYDHDLGLVRLRRHLRQLAQQRLAAG
ncbi:MAG: aromatic ring-hydroxylating dioxygenase subunit alpha [Pigmentiphaga sp.]|uniref:aromatic ring-hydroxylating dioxygenase subunit alpha n=1 Tax=Pigmentiphaga sp. TaxID=1977564 RepID=UPI0029AE9E7A|nr:aromatic ring-hydroxylating dioxygenase subunit alpha [Pigmentiphaga sp.]MDX3907040.1 aromatic ring-hydroxylating dioxygenase subunit alpha [Pigmentiphaga sp.]